MWSEPSRLHVEHQQCQYETPAPLQLAFSSYVHLRWQGLILDRFPQGLRVPMSFQIRQLCAKPHAAAVSTCRCGSFTRCSELITLNSIWSVSWYRLSPMRMAVYLLPPTLPDTLKKRGKNSHSNRKYNQQLLLSSSSLPYFVTDVLQFTCLFPWTINWS